jgi:transposase
MEAKMQVIIERCAGFDVHQETVVACVLIGAPGEWPRKQVRTFRTMTRDLEALRNWLQELGVTQVGMESTGVYWRPVYAVLEGHFDLIVGNARHIRNVPGRKTDVKDAEWIADLVRHGLIAKSFVPPAPQRELRELLRYRRKLVESQAAERNRLLKLLETANIKLASVASDVFGVSGRAMLKALIEGSASAEAMADLARGNCAVSGTIWFWRSKGGWRSTIVSCLRHNCAVSKRPSRISPPSTTASKPSSSLTAFSTRC